MFKFLDSIYWKITLYVIAGVCMCAAIYFAEVGDLAKEILFSTLSILGFIEAK